MEPFFGVFFLVLVWVFFSVFFCVFVLGCVISFSCCAFRVPFWPWVLGAVLLFLPSGFFVAVLACVFSSFACFFGAFLALGAGRRAALFAIGLFCGSFGYCFLFFCGLFFKESDFFIF